MLSVQRKALLGKLNRPMKQALEGAAGLCVQASHYEVTIEHFLLKLAEDENGDVQAILRHFEVEPAQFIKSMQKGVDKMKSGNTGKPVFTRTVFDLMQEAWLVGSIELGLGEIRSGTLMLAIAVNPDRTDIGEYTGAFEEIRAETLRNEFFDIVGGTGEHRLTASAGALGSASGAEPDARKVHGRDPDSALAKYTIDFTAEARAGNIDPIFERDREIRQTIDILARRRKNNPIIVGEAGTGKSALVEGLALRIVDGDVPEILRNVDLLSLDMGLLQAGASMKGQFEERLKAVLSEVKASAKPIILFIDEAHTLIGAGAAAGGSDAANLLKPALARGELRTIAATTWTEYKKYFERDPALTRRFQVIKVDEPSEESAVVMMRGLRGIYEKAHQVRIRDDAVVAAAKLSNRYISGRLLPDKAVDLLDTAAARVKVSLTAKPTSLDDAERRVVTLQREIDSLCRDQEAGIEIDESHVAELEEEIRELEAKGAEIKERWLKEKKLADRIVEINRALGTVEAPPEDKNGAEEAETPDAKAEPQAEKIGTPDEKAEGDGAEATEESAGEEPVDREALGAELVEKLRELEGIQGNDPLIFVDVNPEAIAHVVADWTGIPIGSMVRDEAASILTMQDDMSKRIKGQDHALEAIAEGIRAAKAGVANPETPLGVFLLVGPSGVGKTETALTLADLLFGGERFMCTINMSEFQEKHTVSRLVGSPPGYVGYGEGGVLTEAVRQRPYSVVLLDEVEKANLDVMNIFYQVFDKGMLADGEGRVIDFKNTVVFLTSNLATEEIMQLTSGPTPIGADELATQIRPVLSKHFKPALLARMRIVPFYPLRGEAMASIVRLKVDKVGKRLKASHGMSFAYTDAVVDQISQRCTEVETGARNIDHILNGTLLPMISTQILERLSEGDLPDHLDLDMSEGGEFALNFSAAEPAPEPSKSPAAPATADA